MDSIKKFWEILGPSNQKLVKILGSFLGAVILIIIFISIYTAIVGTKVSYTKLENIVENAATRYYAANNSELPSSEGESVKITTDTLISGKYMKEFSKYTSDTGCSGEVKVTNNNGNYLYNTKLKCNDYKTKTISDVVESSLVNSGDGLYVANNSYYYRGEYVNNYIKIGTVTYRIVGIDSSDNIQVINTDLGNDVYDWDDRYNSEKNQDSLGINDYSKSRLKESLDKIYKNYAATLKKYIVNYNWCIGPRLSTDGNLALDECSKTESDFIGTITVQNYAKASLDSNCTSAFSGSCKNYNYLNDVIKNTIWTITPASDNTYTAYSIASGVVESKTTLWYFKVLQSFNISGSNIYVSGDGSQSNPYVIK